MALEARAKGKQPRVSGEYTVVRPRRDADQALPLGRYGAAPESQRVLDEYDFDAPTRRPLELEGEEERRSYEAPPPASIVARLASLRPPRASAASPSAGSIALTVVCVMLGGALLIAAVGVLMALLSHA